MERSSQIENIAATVIIVFMALGSFYIVRPFLPAVLWAIIFAVSCWPLFTRIEKKLDGRRGVTAGIVILLFVSVVLFPLCFAVMKLAEAIPSVMEALSAALQSGMPPVPEWIGRVPVVGDRLVEQWAHLGTEAPDMAALVGPDLKSLAPNALGPGSSVGRTLGLVLLSLLMLFCFLREGHAIVATLESMVILLGGEKGLRLLRLAATTMSSVVYGILGTAIIQGILATFAFWLAGVPGLLVFGSAVFVLAIITSVRPVSSCFPWPDGSFTRARPAGASS